MIFKVEKLVLRKQNSLITLIPYPHNSAIHAIPYFLLGIICGAISGSSAVRDHLRFNLGIICGPGSFVVRDHLRSNMGIICGPGSFAVQYVDHLRFNLGIICGPGSFAEPYRSDSWIEIPVITPPRSSFSLNLHYSFLERLLKRRMKSLIPWMNSLIR